MIKPIWLTVFKKRGWLAIIVGLSIAGCAADMDDMIISASLHQATTGESALTKVPPTRFRIDDVQDSRDVAGPAGLIGERKTIGNISMGFVEITPPPTELIRAMLTAELQSAGHALVDKNAKFILTSRVDTFRLTTPVTATYWDVTIDAIMALQAQGTAKEVFDTSYSANCVERTYAWPNEDIILRMVTQCVDKLADALRNDTVLGDFLRRQ